MKKIIKTFSLIVVAAAAVSVFLFLGAHFYLKTEHAQRVIRTNLGKIIQGELVLQDISVSLLKGCLEIRGAVLRDRAGKKLASFDDLHVTISQASLFHGRLAVKRAVVRRPWIYLGVEENNRLMLMQVFSCHDGQSGVETQGGGFPLKVGIDELIITDGAVLYENTDRSLRADLSGIELLADADLYARSMNFSAQAARVSLTGQKIHAELQALRARLSLQKEVIGPILIQAETGISRLSVKGSVREISTEPEFDLICETTVSLSEIKEIMDLPEELTGNIIARLALKGKMDNPGLGIQLDYGGGVIAGIRIDSAELEAGLADQVLEVIDAHALCAFGSVRANGRVDLREVFPEGIFAGNRDLDQISWNFKVRGEGIDLEKLPASDLALKGKLNTDIDLCGKGISSRSSSSRISAVMLCENLVFSQNGPAVDVSIKALGTVEDSIVKVDILEACSGQTTLAARGSLELSSQEIAARIEINAPDLKNTLMPFGIDGDGRIAAAVEVSETLSHPSFDVSLNGRHLCIEGITLGDVACSGGLDRQGIVRISNLSLANKDSRIQGSGSIRLYERFPEIGLDPVLAFTADMDAVDIRNFFNAPGFSGVLEGKLQVGGGLYSPEARIDLCAAGLQVKDYPIGEVNAEITLSGSGSFADPALKGDIILREVFIDQDRPVDVRLTLDLRDGIVHVSGDQGLDFNASYIIGKGDFTAAIRFDNLDLSPYFQIVRSPDLTGTITGKIEGGGNIHSMKNARASMDISRLSIRFMGREIVQGESLRAESTGKEVSVPGIHLVLAEGGWVDIKGGGSFDETLSLMADGDIPLQVLAPFFEELSEASGRGLLSGSFRLIDKVYRLGADLGLKDVAFMVPYADQKVHDIEGHIIVSHDSITFREVSGRSGNGRFDLKGTVALRKMKPEEIDLELLAISFPVHVRDTMDLLADMEISVEGTRDDSLIQGDIALIEGAYYKDMELNIMKEAVGSRPETRTPVGPITLPYLRNMKLDIRVNRR
ncbi:MAG TPA: hypothetical protein PLM29_04645, partial [Deltaproteobacteria bacterium]|nr:hypothetical protein [Deltaproteobacteria bacterium]